MASAQNLTQAQKMDMVMKGLSPLNPDHLQTYFQSRGNVRTSFQEQAERLSTLIGTDPSGKSIFHQRTNLGSSRESDRDYDVAFQKTGLADSAATSRPVATNPRMLMEQDMEGYYSSAPGSNVISSSQLLSLRENNSMPAPTKQSPVNKQQAYQTGYKSTISYLNAFIINIKKPSINSRMQLFKELKRVMEIEQKLRNNPEALGAFRKGCDKAEAEMYNKLKS